MAAPAFGSAGTYLTGATSATMNVAVPSGVAADDIIIVAAYLDGTATVSGLASGFAQTTGSPVSPTNQAQRFYVMWKRATGSDAGTYNFTLSASTYREAVAVRYTGAVTSGDPWDATNTATANNPNAPLTTPPVSVTTTGADRLLVFAASYWAGQAFTPPAGFTERVDAGSEFTVDDLAQAVAGSSGSVSTAVGSTSFSTAAWLGALSPFAAPPPSGQRTGPLKLGRTERWAMRDDITRAGNNLTEELLGQSTGVTPISLADGGTGTETATATATLTLTESGVGAQTLTVSVPVDLADAGAGMEALAAGIAIGFADSGTSTQTVAVTATASLTQAGTGTETLQTSATVPLSDAGIGGQNIIVTAAVGLNDAGNGTDNLTAGIAIPLTDTGVGNDDLTILPVVALTDAGTSTQTITVAALAQLAEAGAAAQLLTITSATTLTQFGAGADTLTVQRPVSLADAGTGSDAVSVSIPPSTITRPDTGTVARPATGSVTRPTSGTVARPTTGVVGRPNTDIVQRP